MHRSLKPLCFVSWSNFVVWWAYHCNYLL